MKRHPTELMTDFQRAANGEADIDIHAVLWDIIGDICDSYGLALDAEMMAGKMTAETNIAVRTTVADYLANHYGE